MNENKFFQILGEAYQSRFEETVELIKKSGCDPLEAYSVATIWDFFPELTRLEKPLDKENFDVLYALAQDIDKLNFTWYGDTDLQKALKFFGTCASLHRKIDVKAFQERCNHKNIEFFEELVETVLHQRLLMFDDIIRCINEEDESGCINIERYQDGTTNVCFMPIVARSTYRTQWGD